MPSSRFTIGYYYYYRQFASSFYIETVVCFMEMIITNNLLRDCNELSRKKNQDKGRKRYKPFMNICRDPPAIGLGTYPALSLDDCRNEDCKVLTDSLTNFRGQFSKGRP